MNTTHPAFQARPPICYTADSCTTTLPASHGTKTYGTLFGDGTGAPRPDVKGMLPEGQGIFSLVWASFASLVDPVGPYQAVFASASVCVGDAATAAFLDDQIFHYDLLFCTAMGNFGSYVCGLALAKNAVSVGGVTHNDNPNRLTHSWTEASYGPAPDGRVKPDLTHFYDAVLTTDQGGEYSLFGGTSGSTPITGGNFGLFFQMWDAGIFGNAIDPAASVFESRCHSTAAKAMLINTARPYDFTTGPPEAPNRTLTRDKQGWGMASAGKLYASRNNFLRIVDETTVLGEIVDGAIYFADVPANAFALRATMVYMDPMGNPSAKEAWINDLDLKLRSPSGTLYYGNYGLVADIWSAAGGKNDAVGVDTVENVFRKNPEAGSWQVTVVADEINQDARLETPGVDDVDFSLVVSVDFDCNGNERADSEDIVDPINPSHDCDDDTFPDECDRGNGAVKSEGCRYVGITPPPGTEPVAIRVTGDPENPAVACVDAYVQANGTLGPASAPVFRTPTAWGIAHCADEEIIPSAKYLVETHTDGGPHSAPRCATTWRWGDVTPAGGDGEVILDDILCVLDAFAGTFTPDCTPSSADLYGCVPNHEIDLDDMISVLDAFADMPYPCNPPCMGLLLEMGGGEGPAPPPGTIRIARNLSAGGPGLVAVDVFLTGVEFRGYQLSIEAIAGPRANGRLEVIDMVIDEQRPDFIFRDAPPGGPGGLGYYTAIDRVGGRIAVALPQGSVAPSGEVYLGTVVLRREAGARGRFHIRHRPEHTLLRDSDGQAIEVADNGGADIDVDDAP